MFEATTRIERQALMAGGVFVLLLLAFSAWSGNYYVLVLPFALLFVCLLLLNWRAAWWIFLFSVPLSQQIFLLNKSLST
jgi:O-antigen ligase